MNTRSKHTLEIIEKHKDHFDQRLIEIVDELKSQNSNLLDSVAYKNAQLSSQKQSIVGFKKKIADLTAENHNLKMANKKANMTVEDIEEALKKMQKELDRLTIENEKAIEEVKRQKQISEELNKILNKMKGSNSSNSNMPSSMDILSHSVPQNKKPCNSRKESNRNRGGQIGHTVHRSHLDSSADEIRNLYVKKAPTGAEAVKDKDGNVLYYRTHEIDLSVKTKKIETRYYVTKTEAEISEEEKQKYKINPVTYSAHFKSAMIYLNQRGTIPYERLSEIISELSNNEIRIKPSTMVKWANEFSEKSIKRSEEILNDIKNGKVINVDETGLKIDGTQNWIHTITNESGTYYVVTESRSDKENGPIGLLSDYENTLVHDHFKPYYGLEKCNHGECNAHIERYLQEGIDFENSEACKEVKEILQKALARKHELESKGIHEMDSAEIETIKSDLLRVMKAELERYDKEHTSISKKLEADYIKLFRRMTEYVEEHLLFLRDFDVPYTNNAAERSCRKVKTKKNVSHQFVSKSGAESYASAMTIIETARQNKESALSAIENIMK